MKITFCAVIIVSMVLLVSATVWEGVAEVSVAGEVPGNYSVATNSFPRNTVVDIVNLENGRMVRVKVVSGLEPSGGPLAMLSRVAAESIDLHGNSSGRIRMSQPSDEIAFSLFNLGPITPAASHAATSPSELSSHAATTPAAVSHTETFPDAVSPAITSPITVSPAETSPAAVSRSAELDARGDANRSDAPVKADGYAGFPMEISVTGAYPVTNTVQEFTGQVSAEQGFNSAENLLSPITAPILETPAVATGYYGEGIVYGRLTLVPSEERIPTATGHVIAPEDIIPSIGAAITAEPVAASTLEYLPPVSAVTVQPEPEYLPSVESFAEFSPFQAPLISRLEPNKWYVQVALHGRADYVEDEISRIGTSYPLAVQNIGTDTSPLFRILLGPLNQGESGAMLQRFKSLGYSDAFVRRN